MMNFVFNMPVRMLKVDQELSLHHAEETHFQEWNFDRAIILIFRQRDHHRHLFSIELDEARIGHLTAQRLAESSLFKRWQSRNEV